MQKKALLQRKDCGSALFLLQIMQDCPVRTDSDTFQRKLRSAAKAPHAILSCLYTVGQMLKIDFIASSRDHHK